MNIVIAGTDTGTDTGFSIGIGIRVGTDLDIPASASDQHLTSTSTSTDSQIAGPTNGITNESRNCLHPASNGTLQKLRF